VDVSKIRGIEMKNCMRNGCAKKMDSRGLCRSHYEEVMKKIRSNPPIEVVLIERGLLLKSRKTRKINTESYEPSPEEIKRECAKIRKGWPETRFESAEKEPWFPTVHRIGILTGS